MDFSLATPRISPFLPCRMPTRHLPVSITPNLNREHRKEHVDRRMGEGVGFDPIWRLAPPSRFRVDPVTATSAPLRAGNTPQLFLLLHRDCYLLLRGNFRSPTSSNF